MDPSVPAIVPALVQYQLAQEAASPEQLKLHVYEEWSPPLWAAANGLATGAVGVLRSLQAASEAASRTQDSIRSREIVTSLV